MGFTKIKHMAVPTLTILLRNSGSLLILMSKLGIQVELFFHYILLFSLFSVFGLECVINPANNTCFKNDLEMSTII